jgi:iron complex transport system substrate-binding protein
VSDIRVTRSSREHSGAENRLASRSPVRALAAVLAVICVSLFGLAACGSSGQGTDGEKRVFAEAEDGAFPVTVQHTYGQTTIESQAQRVVVVGWAGSDLAVQLGTVPVAQGPAGGTGDSAEFYPWFRDAVSDLGAPLPATDPSLERGEVNTEFVLKQNPDLILAVQSGITADEYRKLSDIAPTVAFPDEPWGTSAEDHLDMVAEALGRPSLAEKVTGELDDRIAETAGKHEDLAGKTFLYGFLPEDGQTVIFSDTDPRVKTLQKLGLVDSTDLAALAEESDGVSSFNVSIEKLIATTADLYVTGADREKWDAASRSDRAFAAWGPVRDGHAALMTDSDVNLALSVSTPLSLAWAIDDIADVLSAAL